MKALFYKDICTLKKQIWFYVAFYGIYTLIMAKTQQLSFLAGVLVMVSSTIPMSAIAYDEQSKWQLFGQVLPIAKKDFVSEKYCLGICGMGIAVLMVFITGAVGCLFGLLPSDIDAIIEYVGVTATVLVLGLMMLAISLPIAFKLGVEKSRLILLGGNLIVFFGLIQLVSVKPVQEAVRWLVIHPTVMIGVIAVTTAVILAISFAISVSIYKKKEFS